MRIAIVDQPQIQVNYGLFTRIITFRSLGSSPTQLSQWQNLLTLTASVGRAHEWLGGQIGQQPKAQLAKFLGN